MSESTPRYGPTHTAHSAVLFWGCFIALVTTAFGFIARIFLIDTWATGFDLDAPRAGRLLGIGIWPFAVSIIGFSLIIDKIGYKVAMIIAFLGHIIWAVMAVTAYFAALNGNKDFGYQLLYWGSLILALGNGTVEAFINPVVATLFSKEKTKWLNILHAGWPGGLVVAGIVTIFLDGLYPIPEGAPEAIVIDSTVLWARPWWIKVGLIALPALIYFLLLLFQHFPEQERVSSGVSYREMLAEFGILGSVVVGSLVFLQLTDFFSDNNTRTPTEVEYYIFGGIGIAIVLGFGLYTRSVGRILMFFMVFIMMPLATTEIGTDGWITDIMRPIAKSEGFDPGWLLVYTSAIMLVLRFFAGPIVHAFSPLGLLAVSALLAIVGLYTLSFTAGIMIFVAATLYGFGKTFFWPTMLGVVAEQTPKGGALTLNAISGIGMIAVGTLGFPFIGALQSNQENRAVLNAPISKELPGLVVKDSQTELEKLTVLEDKKIYEIIHYQKFDDKKFAGLVNALTPAARFKLEAAEVTVKEGQLVTGVKVDDNAVKAAKVDPKTTLVLADATGKHLELAKKDIAKIRPGVLEQISDLRGKSKQGALAFMAIFPAIMLVSYLILIGYFKAKGGYKPVHLGAEGH